MWTWMDVCVDVCMYVRKNNNKKGLPRGYMTSNILTRKQRIWTVTCPSTTFYVFLYGALRICKRSEAMEGRNGWMMEEGRKKKPKFTAVCLVWSRSVIMNGCELCGWRSEKDEWAGCG